MIRKIRFQDFRGIREGELELSPLTVLIGANGSGKTTVLEALLLTHGARSLYGKTIFHILSEMHETLTSKGILHLIHKYGSQNKKALIKLENDSGWKNFLIKLIGDTLTIGMSESGNEAFYQIASLNKYNMGGTYNDTIYLYNVLFIRDNLLKDIYHFINVNWIELSASGLTTRIASSLSKIIGLDITDILNEPFIGGSYALMVRLGDGSRIRLGDLGEGIQLLIAFSLLVEYMNPDLILWDDIEAHMNPRSLVYIANKLVDLVDNGKQVVVTTHSIEAARLLSGIAEKARIVKLELTGGYLKTTPLSYEKLEKYIDLGIDVRI